MVQKITRETQDTSEKEIIHKDRSLDAISLTSYLQNIGKVISTYVTKNQWVMCEIISFNNTRGNYYFEIVDTSDDAQRTKGITAILFKSKVFSLFGKFQSQTGVPLSNGMKIMIKLNTNFDPKFGISLYIDDINPSFTIGEMEAKSNNIRAAMVSQKIDKKNKSLIIPSHFTSIAVLSPSGAAGLGDFKVEADLLEKYNLCKFEYFTATFEGDSVQSTIVDAFKQIHQSGFENYDCLVFIRGGGAKSSLQYLNEELILKCVCRTPIPIISGIGHEKDKVLIDEFVSLSLDTPSKVIEFITNANIKNITEALSTVESIEVYAEKVLNKYESNYKQEEEQIFTLIDKNLVNAEHKSQSMVNVIFSESINRLSDAENSNTSTVNIIFNTAIDSINDLEMKSKMLVNNVESTIDSILSDSEMASNVLIDKIYSEADRLVENAEKDIKHISSDIASLDPKNVLNRGYSIVRSEGKVIKNALELNSLKSIEIIFKDGKKEINLN